ncbi:NAD(P)-dependent oxidoreductase [Nocardia sp. NPDC055321]
MTADPAAVPVGFIGLGNMGAPIATRLLAWPGGLTVCDVRPEATEPFTTAGARAVSTPAELAEHARVICVTVIDDAQVREVLTGPQGILRTAAPGTVVAVHSTISDRTAEELAAECAEYTVEFIDAPVSGGASAAQRGSLAVMAGGSDAALAAIREPFACFSDRLVHTGPVGTGTRMKLARNLLHFVSFTAATEAQRLAEAAGLDLTALGKIVRHSDAITGGAGSIMLRDNTAPIDPDDFWFPILTHVRNLGEKDLSLAADLGERLGVDLPLTRLALGGLAAGLGVATPALTTENS